MNERTPATPTRGGVKHADVPGADRRNRKEREASVREQVRHVVQHARRNAGLTQRQLAERTGIPQSAIARIETGQHLPSLRTILQIVDVLTLNIEISPHGLTVKPATPTVELVERGGWLIAVSPESAPRLTDEDVEQLREVILDERSLVE